MLASNRIPQGSTILLTGASGFVGSSIAQELLEAGYKVRGAGRDPSRFKELQAKFDRTYGKDRFQAIQIDNYRDTAAMAAAVQGVAGVIHTANDSSWGTDFDEVVNFAVASAVGLMKVAAKESSVKSFVYTSSRVAAFNYAGEPIRATEDSWLNEVAPMAQAVPFDHPMKAILVYASSKVEAEKAAWKWYQDAKPGYTFNAVLPDYVMGKVVNPRAGVYTTNTYLNEFYNGNYSEDMEFYKFTTPPSMFVDVLDVAKAHVIALVGEDVKNERIFAMTGTFSVADIADAIHLAQPHHRLPDYSKALGRSDIEAPNGRFKKLLKQYYGLKPITLEHSVARTILDA